MNLQPIRHAATVILVRDAASDPSVLMGRRGRRAAFMPDKFVFPGGAVDAADAGVPLDGALSATCRARLAEATEGPDPETLAAAAIRELWEETGLVLGRPGEWSDPPADWAGFAASGHRPSAVGLSFVFRAVTPPDRPRRFDARFFVADAARLATSPDAYEDRGELSDLRWIRAADARKYELPFITEVALAEVVRRLPDLGPPTHVPFFRNRDEDREIARLGGASPLSV